MKEKRVDKWLGQYLSSLGLADSADETVKHQEGKLRGAVLEIAQIVNDWRSHLAGGMVTAVTLWERCCVPSLLHGAGAWVNISPETIKRLNSTQQWYWRLILQVGPGAPLVSLSWDVAWLGRGSAGCSTRYLEQQAMVWPGLSAEVEHICKVLHYQMQQIRL